MKGEERRMRGEFPELREEGWMDYMIDLVRERYMKSSRVPFGECEVLSIGRE